DGQIGPGGQATHRHDSSDGRPAAVEDLVAGASAVATEDRSTRQIMPTEIGAEGEGQRAQGCQYPAPPRPEHAERHHFCGGMVNRVARNIGWERQGWECRWRRAPGCRALWSARRRG